MAQTGEDSGILLNSYREDVCFLSLGTFKIVKRKEACQKVNSKVCFSVRIHIVKRVYVAQKTLKSDHILLEAVQNITQDFVTFLITLFT